jgi:hypothetical protein
MVSEYWARRIEREHKESMEIFNKEKAMEEKARIEYRLHSKPHIFVDDVNPMVDTFGETSNINKTSLEGKE